MVIRLSISRCPRFTPWRFSCSSPPMRDEFFNYIIRFCTTTIAFPTLGKGTLEEPENAIARKRSGKRRRLLDGGKGRMLRLLPGDGRGGIGSRISYTSGTRIDRARMRSIRRSSAPRPTRSASHSSNETPLRTSRRSQTPFGSCGRPGSGSMAQSSGTSRPTARWSNVSAATWVSTCCCPSGSGIRGRSSPGSSMPGSR